MLDFLKKRIYPIGVDLGSNYLKMAQMGFDGTQKYLHAALCEARPDEIEFGSSDWQRWAARTAKKMVAKGDFKGRSVVTAMPSDDLYIDQLKIAKCPDDHVDKVVFDKVKKKLPFDSKGAMVKSIVAGQFGGNGDIDVLVMATSRVIVDRHLAIYERAGLEIRSLGVWPIALINSYINFFGRRDADVDTVTMLMDIGSNHSNIIICRHKSLLFARVIPIGFRQINQGQMVQRLMVEIDACCRFFESVSGGLRIQRLIFLSGRSVDRVICDKVAEIAEKMQIPAQIGDVLAAIEARTKHPEDVDRRGCQIDWAMAFGLALYEAENL